MKAKLVYSNYIRFMKPFSPKENLKIDWFS